MKKSACTNRIQSPQDILVQHPAYPKTGSELFRKLKQGLDKTECAPGGQLTQTELGQLLGMPKSTVNDWYHGKLAKQVRYFQCALERLSETARKELQGSINRECPRLDHPRLAHDRRAVNALKTLLVRPTGLTLVHGDSDGLRTFLIAAFGHSARKIIPGTKVGGLDIHAPDLFVPVHGVQYFRQPIEPSKAERVLPGVWRRLENSKAQLLLFNGVWNMWPEFRPGILKLAKTNHVIVADEFPPAFLRNRRQRKAVNLVGVSNGKDTRILVQVKPGPLHRPGLAPKR